MWLKHTEDLRGTGDTASNCVPSTPLGWLQTYFSYGHPEDCVIMHELWRGRFLTSPFFLNFMKDPECIMPALQSLPGEESERAKIWDTLTSLTEWISNSVFEWFLSLQVKACFWEIIPVNTNSFFKNENKFLTTNF